MEMKGYFSRNEVESGGNITELQEHVSMENLQYHDLIQSDFTDSYNNLTIKTMVIMDWLATRCSLLSPSCPLEVETLVSPTCPLEEETLSQWQPARPASGSQRGQWQPARPVAASAASGSQRGQWQPARLACRRS
ncbi:unnamed protein product [Gadus morhua 'NCC']